MDFRFSFHFIFCAACVCAACVSVCQSVCACVEFACAIVIMFDFIWSFIILHTTEMTKERKNWFARLSFFPFLTMIFVAHTRAHKEWRSSKSSFFECQHKKSFVIVIHIEFLNRFEQRQLASILNFWNEENKNLRRISLAFQHFQFHSIINWMFYERSNKSTRLNCVWFAFLFFMHNFINILQTNLHFFCAFWVVCPVMNSI